MGVRDEGQEARRELNEGVGGDPKWELGKDAYLLSIDSKGVSEDVRCKCGFQRVYKVFPFIILCKC